MKTTRIAPGYYTTTHNGATYRIINLGGDTAGFTGWTWRGDNDGGDDIYPTKRAALEALADFLAPAPVAAPAAVESFAAMIGRAARAADANRPAGCKTLVMG